MSTNTQQKKTRQNKRSTQFGQNRAKQRAQSTGESSTVPNFGTLRLEWVRRGPGDLDILQFPYQWVAKAESSLKATSNDIWYIIDLHEYVKDMMEFPTSVKGFVFLFEANLSGQACLVTKKTGSFKDAFSSLNAFKFEKGCHTAVQLLAPSILTFATFSAGEVALVFKFEGTLTAGAEFMTRKVWGQSSMLPKVEINKNLLRGQ
ncbi:coat protein [Tea plant line pattern virus]|uniref:coat protein n=1 Tax=Tea plant line pattern virus TaxID=2419940 RepID=UPI000EB6644C|nr:coat protein [Tea plant line pattern virus]AYE53927.1 coat protein [Tea plant line pattern virus]